VLKRNVDNIVLMRSEESYIEFSTLTGNTTKRKVCFVLRVPEITFCPGIYSLK
jgi:hypothetical protein